MEIFIKEDMQNELNELKEKWGEVEELAFFNKLWFLGFDFIFIHIKFIFTHYEI